MNTTKFPAPGLSLAMLALALLAQAATAAILGDSAGNFITDAVGGNGGGRAAAAGHAVLGVAGQPAAGQSTAAGFKLFHGAISPVLAAATLDITDHPDNVFVAEGDPFSLSVSAAGVFPLTYQWYHNDDPIDGATDRTYAVDAAAYADAGLYFCRVWDATDEHIDSDSVQVNVQAASFDIEQDPQDAFGYTGENAQFAIEVTGGLGTLRYAWYHNGQPIGEGAPVLNLTGLEIAMSGEYYCEVQDDSGVPRQSKTAILTVADPLAIAAHPKNLSVNAGETAVFQVGISGGFAPYSYQWTKNGQNLEQGISEMLNIGSAGTEDIGVYQVIVHDDYTGIAVSNTAALDVIAGLPAAGKTGLLLMLCALLAAGSLLMAAARPAKHP